MSDFYLRKHTSVPSFALCLPGPRWPYRSILATPAGWLTPILYLFIVPTVHPVPPIYQQAACSSKVCRLSAIISLRSLVHDPASNICISNASYAVDAEVLLDSINTLTFSSDLVIWQIFNRLEEGCSLFVRISFYVYFCLNWFCCNFFNLLGFGGRLLPTKMYHKPWWQDS